MTTHMNYVSPVIAWCCVFSSGKAEAKNDSVQWYIVSGLSMP